MYAGGVGAGADAEVDVDAYADLDAEVAGTFSPEFDWHAESRTTPAAVAARHTVSPAFFTSAPIVGFMCGLARCYLNG